MRVISDFDEQFTAKNSPTPEIGYFVNFTAYRAGKEDIIAETRKFWQFSFVFYFIVIFKPLYFFKILVPDLILSHKNSYICHSKILKNTK
jgi:hypothetical protein